MRKKNLAEVLQADVTTNLPVAALAQIVRSKGRGRDTILAHITPREARKLKREGGSGTINPETGLPEFEDSFSFTEFPMSIDYSAATPPAELTQVPETAYQTPLSESYSYGDFQPTYSSGTGGARLAFGAEPYFGSADRAVDFSRFDTPVPANIPFGTQTVAYAPLPVARTAGLDATADMGAYRALATGGAPEEGGRSQAEIDKIIAGQEDALKRLSALEQAKGGTAQKGLFDRLTSDPLKLALLAGGAGLGLMTQRRASQQAGDVANQMRAMAAEQRAAAQPFLQQGGLQFGLATQGALTPAAQQQFDVARAQLAQAAARSGSVGAMQATQIAEQLRQQAIANQLTQALQTLAPGNALMNQSIATQINALNSQVNLQNAAAQAAGNFYSNLAKFAVA